MSGKRYFEAFSIEMVGLAFKFEVNPSSCGNAAYFSDYLKYNALHDSSTGRGITHVLVEETDDSNKVIIGYVTLKSTALFTDIEVDGQSRISGEPALEISNLAVHKDYEKQGIGSALIDFVVDMAAEIGSNHVAIKHIVLAADEMAEGFYKKKDFNYFRDYFDMPRSYENVGCTPMFMTLW